MKKICFLLIILLLSGCSYTELNDLSIIKSIGISYQDDKYLLSASIIDEISEDNLPKTKIITVNEDSITKCFNKLLVLSNKTIHYSHIDLLIFDPILNNNQLEEVFDYFLQNTEFRNDFAVISSNEMNNILENSDYDELEQFLENNQHQKIIKIDIENVIKTYLEKRQFTLSLFSYLDENINYQKNITLPSKEVNYE